MISPRIYLQNIFGNKTCLQEDWQSCEKAVKETSMKVISFANQKGGVGKSTLCMNLAVVAGDALILDVDPQQTVSQWFQSRPEDRSLPECAKVKPASVGTILKSP